METYIRPAFDYMLPLVGQGPAPGLAEQEVRLMKISERAEDIVGTPIMQLVLPIILARYESNILPFLDRVVDKLK